MEAQKHEPKREVIKHSAAIQIENSITLLQRRAWNVLLYNAYNKLLYEETHSIAVKYLAHILEFDSKNEDYLKEALEALVGCKVKWNLLDKDGSEVWGVAALLAAAEIKNGICSYSYAPQFRTRLYNPRIYARLDLGLQKQFDSKYGLALWELCADYLGSERGYGETRFLLLEEFRTLMGVSESYPTFKKLNERVLKPALDEINHVSDFRVSVEYQKKGRLIVALKFKIQRVALLSVQSMGEGTLLPDLNDMPTAVKELKEAGLATQEAWMIWQQGFASVQEARRPVDFGEDMQSAFLQYIREKIHLLKRRQVSGKVENSTGFLLSAIREDYTNPEFKHEQIRQYTHRTQETRRKQEREVKGLQQQRVALEKARDDALQTLCLEVVKEQSETLQKTAIPTLLRENSLFRSRYDSAKSVYDNYRDGGILVQASLNPYLEKYATVRFEAVRQDYATQIAILEADLEAEIVSYTH